MAQDGETTADNPLISEAPRGKVEFIGKYRLLAKLGHGGMANVFLAVAHGPASFNKLVVIKRLHSIIAESESHIAMFLDEAKLSARLNHPNIVHTYEVGEADGVFFIVMEYLEGQPLNRITKAILREDPGASGFTRGIWVKIIAEVLSGLHHAHELCDYDGAPLGIVHRDVSPHNVFVTYDGGVKVVDFGIAKAALNTTTTESGVFKGKLSYMSPEQARGLRTMDRRVDVFAAGVVLWELLTQRRLFKGDAIDTLRRLANEDVVRVSTVDPSIPAALDDIVAKAVQSDPDKRYASALEMRQALDKYLRSTGEDIQMVEVATRMSGLFSERRALVHRQIKIQLEQSNLASDGRVSLSPRPAGGEVRVPSGTGSSTHSLPTLEEGSGTSSSSSREHRLDSDSASLKPTTVPTRRLKRGYVIGAVGGAALVAGIAFALRSRPVQAPAESVSTAPATQTVGTLSVASEPPEAYVRWEGRLMGKTPIKIDLPTGTQSVIVAAPGYFEETLLVTISPSLSTERIVTLRRKNLPAAPSATTASIPSETSNNAKATDARRPHESPDAGAASKASASAAPPQSVSPTPAATPSAVPAKPGIQIVDENVKPMVNVKVVD